MTCCCSGTFTVWGWDSRLPDKSTILQFRHILERHKLAAQILKTVNELLTPKGCRSKAAR